MKYPVVNISETKRTCCVKTIILLKGATPVKLQGSEATPNFSGHIISQGSVFDCMLSASCRCNLWNLFLIGDTSPSTFPNQRYHTEKKPKGNHYVLSGIIALAGELRRQAVSNNIAIIGQTVGPKIRLIQHLASVRVLLTKSGKT